MAFDTQTVTIKGAELLAAATAANQLIIDGCDATTGYMTQAQAVNISARPASPVSNTTDVTQLGSTAEHINSRVYFRTGVNAGGDVNTLFLYGHSASAPNDKFVIFVASSQTPFHLPIAGDVIDEWECALDIVYTINPGSVEYATQATYCSLSEFNLLKERTVTTHKEGFPTTGEDQTIYGDKTFEGDVIFISPNNWKMTLGPDGFKIVDSVSTQKTKIDPFTGIISTVGSIISNSPGVYSTFYNLNVTNNLSVSQNTTSNQFTCGNMSWTKQVQSGSVIGGYIGLLDIGNDNKSYLHVFSSSSDSASVDLAATRGGYSGASLYLGGSTTSETSTRISMKIRTPNDSSQTGLTMEWDSVKLTYAATFDMPVTFNESIYPQKSINLSGNQAKVVSTNSGGTQTASFYDGAIDMTGGYIRISDSNRVRFFADTTGIYAYNATDGSLVFSVNSNTSVVTVNGDVYFGISRKTSISQSIIGASTILNITMPSESTGHNYIQVMDAEITVSGVVNVDDNVLNVLDSNGDAAVVLSPQGVNLEHAGTTTAAFRADTGNLTISGKMAVGNGLVGVASYKDNSNNLVVPIGGIVLAYIGKQSTAITKYAGEIIQTTDFNPVPKVGYIRDDGSLTSGGVPDQMGSVDSNLPSGKYACLSTIQVTAAQGCLALLQRVE